jgi:hypothetical protein
MKKIFVLKYIDEALLLREISIPLSKRQKEVLESINNLAVIH